MFPLKNLACKGLNQFSLSLGVGLAGGFLPASQALLRQGVGASSPRSRGRDCALHQADTLPPQRPYPELWMEIPARTYQQRWSGKYPISLTVDFINS